MITLRAGNPYIGFDAAFNECMSDIEVVNGVEFFNSYLFPKPESVLNHYELKSMGLVGVPGTGKSSYMNFLADYIKRFWEKLYGKGCVNLMRVDNVQVAIDHIDDRRFHLIIIDDAMNAQDSRQCLKGDAVTSTQQYMMIRHIADERSREGQGGVIYVLFGFQSPKGIDVRFREQLHVTIYKHYYQHCNLEKIIKDSEVLGQLKEITRQEFQFNQFDYRQYAVGVCLWGDLVLMKVPYVESSEVKTYASFTKKDEIINELVDKLYNNEVYTNQAAAYGFLDKLKESRKELDLYNFTKTDFQRIIHRCKAREFFSGDENNLYLEYFSKLLGFIRNSTKFTFRELESRTGIPKTILHRYAPKDENGGDSRDG